MKATIKQLLELVPIPGDRRCQFRDLQNYPAAVRRPKSSILQFYSKYPNIGNFTPCLGIREMLGMQLDAWNVHDKSIDWAWINRKYKGIIIGGAGLLNAVFEDFWRGCSENCKVPVIIWGVGVCLPENEQTQGVSIRFVEKVANKALLVNVRDSLTADMYRLHNAQVTACPTVVWLQNNAKSIVQGAHKSHSTLLSVHDTLLDAREQKNVADALRSVGPFLATDNVQRFGTGLEDILRLFATSDCVVTSRLHGAIFAYSLGIPYVAISKDPKIAAFVEIYGGGELASGPEDIINFARARPPKLPLPNVEEILKFGRSASAVINSL
jgi:polysaccharide pyruvyl transferase WcaK-like protein